VTELLLHVAIHVALQVDYMLNFLLCTSCAKHSNRYAPDFVRWSACHMVATNRPTVMQFSPNDSPNTQFLAMKRCCRIL